MENQESCLVYNRELSEPGLSWGRLVEWWSSEQPSSDPARDLYQRPGFGETVDFDQIKRHYYMTHDQINPSRIVPMGPVVDWNAPHERG